MKALRHLAVMAAIWAVISLGPGCSREDSTPGTEKAAPSEARLQGKLLITGSSTMAPMVKELGTRFQTLHPLVQVEVQAGGSVKGIREVRAGAADIGMLSRTLKEEEADLYGFPIARDGICLIIHRDNPVKSLTNQQVIDIYTGKTTNWKDLGGPEAAVTVIARTEGRPSQELFEHFFNLNGGEIKASTVVGDNPEAIAAVAADARALAPISVGEAERKAAAGTPIKLLPVDGVAATSKNVRTGDFPISRSLSLVTREFPTGLKRAFINFALSAQVTDVARAYDFVPYLD